MMLLEKCMMGYYLIVVCLGREEKKKEKKVRGVGEGNYFKYFPLKGAINRGMATI